MEERTIWQIKDGEIRKSGLSHFVMMALFTGVGVVVGTFGSIAIPMGMVSAFWPGQAIQSVSCIWYGGWGAISAVVFPIISNAIAGSAALPISIAYIPGNLAQGIFAGIAFRKMNCDPRLRSFKDWLVFLLFGTVLANIIGAAWGNFVLYLFGMITPNAIPVSFLGWFIGNSVASGILGIIMLKYLSPLVMKTKTFCKGLWA
ncbi:diguanylate cyclase family protein [Pectinatus frisingensis]|uniref:hypothetical protein n=1 Tax=Pectinatus frisingensis TaxID=865 RepID=UPI0018C68E39|nr:hypothetical protein [Pectinatus frisingensis]